jgi:hypothetical protein
MKLNILIVLLLVDPAIERVNIFFCIGTVLYPVPDINPLLHILIHLTSV